MITKSRIFLKMSFLSCSIFTVCAFIGALATQRPAETKAEEAINPERWRVYYVDFGFPAKGYGMHTDTGEALLTVTSDFVKGAVWILNGGDSDAPPETLALTRHDGVHLSGSMTSDYPHPIGPYRLSGRYQNRNWGQRPTLLSSQTNECVVDEIVLEVEDSIPRKIFYLAKPCGSE
jgi:hypothetical protein